MTTPTAIVIPDGFTLHTENSSRILLPSTDEAFLNPVQEFNRDLSVACIRTWGDILNEEKEKTWRQAQERRAKKPSRSKPKRPKMEGDVPAQPTPESAAGQPPQLSYEKPTAENTEAEPENQPTSEGKSKNSESGSNFKPYKFVILEALSATGLRSIRYAKEIPLIKHVIANDLSPAAVTAMRRNVDINEFDIQEEPLPSSSDTDIRAKKPMSPKVHINQGDACTLMYKHRPERERVDVVDLDPYGTAAPFIDAAVQCVNDGGLLCVTCTDMSVLATNNYPEKCFSNYGGMPVRAEYSHEAALRLVLNAVSSSASRYGRYIQPLLSLSIDFYVRLFIRIRSAPIEVKKAAIKTAIYYICAGCQSPYSQPLGRMIETVHQPSGNVNLSFKTQAGPTVPDRCPECNHVLHLSGPMWSAPIHDPSFISRVLEHLESNEDKYGTSARMKGMLTVAKEELDTPFYFTPSKVASFFHCVTPNLDDVASALLHAGHRISRSHAVPGSLKTTATRQDLHDVFRSWVKKNPVKMEKVSESSPTFHLLAKEPRTEANFKRHPQSVTPSSQVKLIRYQQNPTANWGPGTRGSSNMKRKRESGDE